MSGPTYLTWAVVQVEATTRNRVRIHYRLSDGTRKSVLIPQADDSPATRQAIGDGLAQGRRLYNPARSRNQPKGQGQ